MVLIELQILPGDTVTRRFKQGARGTATIRDLDAQQINFLVNRSDNLQPAKLEQNYKITDGEEFAISFSRPLSSPKQIFSPDTQPPCREFSLGLKILLRRQIANYFLMKLYGELLSSSPFMNVYFSNRSLVTHGEIVRILDDGVVIKALNKPKSPPKSDSSSSSIIDAPSNDSSSSSSSSIPIESSSLSTSSSSLDDSSSSSSSDPSQEFFVSNNDLKFAEIVTDASLIEAAVESIMKMISVQPGDEVTIKGASDPKMSKVKSITVPLADPLQKKVTMENIQVSFKASNLVLHSKTVSGTDNQTVHLKNGHRYKKVFWSKDRKQLLGVFFDDDNKTLRAETIDESNIVSSKRPSSQDPSSDAHSKMRRLV